MWHNIHNQYIKSKNKYLSDPINSVLTIRWPLLLFLSHFLFLTVHFITYYSFDFNGVFLVTLLHNYWIMYILGHDKKTCFSSAPSSNFYTHKKRAKYSSLWKHVKCMHFSDDMIFFNFQKEKKKKIARPHHFPIFYDENQDIYFSWP